jgi:hypothetical protein
LFEDHLALINRANMHIASVCDNAELSFDNFKDETTMQYQNLRKKQLAKEQESAVVDKITKKL